MTQCRKSYVKNKVLFCVELQRCAQIPVDINSRKQRRHGKKETNFQQIAEYPVLDTIHK